MPGGVFPEHEEMRPTHSISLGCSVGAGAYSCSCVFSFSCASWSRRRTFLSTTRITCKPSHTSVLTGTDKQHLRLGQPATAIHRSMLEGDKFANNTGSVRLNTGPLHLTGRSAPRHRQVDKHEGWISGPGVACFFRRHAAASKSASSESGRSCWLSAGSSCSGLLRRPVWHAKASKDSVLCGLTVAPCELRAYWGFGVLV